MPKLKTPLEREVLAELLKWLNKQDGIWAWRRNVGLMQVKGNFIRYGQKGMADIEGLITIEDFADERQCEICAKRASETVSFEIPKVTRNSKVTVVHKGIHLEVEAKRLGKKPSEDQSAWLLAIQAAGGIGVWADSVEMLKANLSAALLEKGYEL